MGFEKEFEQFWTKVYLIVPDMFDQEEMPILENNIVNHEGMKQRTESLMDKIS